MQDTSLDRSRRLARRRMAGLSFALISIKGIAVYGALLFTESRHEVAQALVAAWPAMMSTQMILASIVLGYLGVSVAEKIWGPK